MPPLALISSTANSWPLRLFTPIGATEPLRGKSIPTLTVSAALTLNTVICDSIAVRPSTLSRLLLIFMVMPQEG